MKRSKYVLFVALVLLSTRARAGKLEAWALNPAYELLALGRTHAVVKTARSEVLLLSVESLQNPLKLRDSSRNLSYAEFSPEGKFLLSVYQRAQGKSEIRIYNVASGQLLQKTPAINELQTGFWLDECRYVSIGGPLRNGGRLQLFKRPDAGVSPCSKEFPVQSVAPPAQAPLAFWKDANFNIWGYYSNSARDVFGWLGRGNFYELQSGAYPYFWFRETSTSSMLFRADQRSKKIQPLRPLDHYVADPKGEHVYGVSKGVLSRIRLDRELHVQDEQLLVLPKDLTLKSLRLDGTRKRLVLQNSAGSYFVLKLGP